MGIWTSGQKVKRVRSRGGPAMDWPRQPKSSYLWDQVPASTMLPLRSYLGRRRSLSRSFSLSLPLCHSFLLPLSPSFSRPPVFLLLFHVLLLHVRLSLFLSSALSCFPPSWYALSLSSLSLSTSPSSSFSLPPFNLAPSHSDPVSAAVLAVVSPVPSHCFTFRVTCCPMHRTRPTVRLYSPTASWIRRRVNFALATVSPQPRSSAKRSRPFHSAIPVFAAVSSFFFAVSQACSTPKTTNGGWESFPDADQASPRFSHRFWHCLRIRYSRMRSTFEENNFISAQFRLTWLIKFVLRWNLARSMTFRSVS